MPGPWDKYAQTGQPSGPWNKYAQGNVQARVTSGDTTISDTAEPGYWEQVGRRLKEQFFPDRTVPLPEAMGITGLVNQYGIPLGEGWTKGSVWQQPNLSAALIEAIPIIGPSINEAVANWAEGKPKTSSAQLTTDVLLPILLQKAMQSGTRTGTTPAPFRNPNATVAQAVEFGQREGIPVDAATASGNFAVQGTQWLADRSIGGSMVTAAEKAKQAEALKATGNRLLNRAHPTSQVPETAGSAVAGSLERTVSQYKRTSDTAYEKFREIESRPENIRTVIEKRPETVKIEGRAKKLSDLQPEQRAALGYPDEPEVRAMIDDAVQARLREIEDLYGSGIGALSGKGKRIAGIGDMTAAAAAEEKQGFGHINVKGAIPELADFKEPPGRIAEAIQKDKNNKLYVRVKEAVEGETREQYSDQIRTANTEARVSKGIEAPIPDEAYWDALLAQDEAAAKAGRPIPLPVDMRPIKAALKPIYEDMEQWMEPAKRNASQGYQAVRSIVNGPDYMRASTAEKGLGGLKALAREAKSPDMANVSQGLGKFSAKMLQDAIDKVVASAGDEAITALREGRAAHLAKMGVAEILDQLRKEPVQTFQQMSYMKDSGIKLIRQVSKLAPDEMSKVGRAYLEDLLATAEKEGEFNRAASAWNKWTNLGRETKRILFKDPQLITDLDDFFLLAKKIGENPNPSGTAFVVAVGAQGYAVATNPMVGIPVQLGAAALAKVLRTRTGVRLLTQGLKVSVSNKPAAALLARQLAAIAGDNRSRQPRQPTDESDLVPTSP